MIYRFAIPDEPEVFMHQGVDRWWDVGKGREPMMVNTAYPVLMHVCRESRDFVLMHSGLRFRLSPDFRHGLRVIPYRPSLDTPCLVPCRPFRPEFDTVFWNEKACYTPDDFLQAPYYHWMQQVRHLAVPTTVFFHDHYAQREVEAIIRNCPNLQKLTLVVASDGFFRDPNTWSVPRAMAPGRRRLLPARLRRADVVRAASVWLWSEPFQPSRVERFLLSFCEDGAGKHGLRGLNLHGLHGENPSEIPRPALLENIECSAQTFVEWRHGGWTRRTTEPWPRYYRACPLAPSSHHNCGMAGYQYLQPRVLW